MGVSVKDLALRITAAHEISTEGMCADEAGTTDSAASQEKKVPGIDFHSLNNQTIQLLYTIDDQLSKFDVSVSVRVLEVCG